MRNLNLSDKMAWANERLHRQALVIMKTNKALIKACDEGAIVISKWSEALKDIPPKTIDQLRRELYT